MLLYHVFYKCSRANNNYYLLLYSFALHLPILIFYFYFLFYEHVFLFYCLLNKTMVVLSNPELVNLYYFPRFVFNTGSISLLHKRKTRRPESSRKKSNFLGSPQYSNWSQTFLCSYYKRVPRLLSYLYTCADGTKPFNTIIL